jgi:hypothetical protein
MVARGRKKSRRRVTPNQMFRAMIERSASSPNCIGTESIPVPSVESTTAKRNRRGR